MIYKHPELYKFLIRYFTAGGDDEAGNKIF